MEVDIKLESIVRPRAELHFAGLDVERKVADVDAARGAEDGWRNPRDFAGIVDDGHRVAMFLEARVGTADNSIDAPDTGRVVSELGLAESWSG